MWQAQEFIRRIGTVLRVRNDDLTHEPLPERWVDLIRYLEDKERLESRDRQRQQTESAACGSHHGQCELVDRSDVAC